MDSLISYVFVHSILSLYIFQDLIIMIDVLFIIHRYPIFSSSSFSHVYVSLHVFYLFH